MKTITAQDLKIWLTDGTEFGFIDVREEGQFGEGHLLHSIPLPYSRLELDIAALVPRADVPVVLVIITDGVPSGRKQTQLLEQQRTV